MKAPVICLLAALAAAGGGLSAQSAPSAPAGQPATSAQSAPLVGVWQNAARFVEIAAGGKLRIVLKPYYGFVYEDTGWMPCAVSGDDTFLLSIRYPGTKTNVTAPVAHLGDGLWFGFYRRFGQAAPGGAGLDGFWKAEGAPAALRLYPEERADEFFCYWFSGASYCRVRYWKTDARFRDLAAEFSAPDGETVLIPKFIRLGEDLYTCIVSTGTTLRNYERGTFALKDGRISFAPENVVYAGTAAAVRESVRVTFSPDGAILALGEPYLTRAQIADLDAEITAHNGLRRPPRKPVFGYMDLDFRWDEIERIRNNGKAPEAP